MVWTVVPAAAGIAATPLVRYAGLCLDLPGNSNAEQTQVQVYTCNGTDGQQWTQEPNGTIQADGKCLDMVVGGTAVDLLTCNGSGAQPWVARADGSLYNPESDACLSDPGPSTTPGTRLQVSKCAASAGQQWASPAAVTGTVTGYTGLCMDVRAANTADRTPVQVDTCGTNPQTWTTEPNGTLRAFGKCLHVAGGGTADHTLVQLYTCNGTGGQNWQPLPNGELVNPASGKCLDDTDYGAGIQLQIYKCWNSSAQHWTLP